MASGRELVFQGASPVFGGARVLPSPSQFFLTGEDRLRVVSANSMAGVSLKVQWRTAHLDGSTIPASFDHTPNSDRTVKTQDFELGVGSLLNVTVFASGSGPISGQTYAMVQLVRGFGAAAIVLGTLLAGYVTGTQALGFPGSPIQSSIEGGGYVRHIPGTDPAAGVEILETVPTGARWELITIKSTLNTSATVGNRRPRLYIDGPSVITLIIIPAVSDIPATASQNFSWAQGVQAYFYANADNLAPLPQNTMFLGGSKIGTSTVGFQPGDNWTSPLYVVREWLEVT